MNNSEDSLKASRTYARLLDEQFSIPGTNIRFGIDPVLGLLTGAGDWAGGLLSIYFMGYAVKKGAGPSVLIRMFVNIMADLLIGVIPLLGDIFDVAWKANTRNLELLEKVNTSPARTEERSRLLMWGLLILLCFLILLSLFLISWMFFELFGMLIG